MEAISELRCRPDDAGSAFERFRSKMGEIDFFGHAPMVNAPFTHVNALFALPDENLQMGDETSVFERVAAELEARGLKWADFRKAMRISRQLMKNWETAESIPVSRYKDVADVLEWSLDRLYGRPNPEAAKPIQFNEHALLAAIFIEGLADDEERMRALATLQFHFRGQRSGLQQSSAPPGQAAAPLKSLPPSPPQKKRQ
jgi:hypothetical protein